jgi:hypothetical protein
MIKSHALTNIAQDQGRCHPHNNTVPRGVNLLRYNLFMIENPAMYQRRIYLELEHVCIYALLITLPLCAQLPRYKRESKRDICDRTWHQDNPIAMAYSPYAYPFHLKTKLISLVAIHYATTTTIMSK